MGFLGAFLMWVALPPVDWWPLAWVAPIPWILLIRRQTLSGCRPYTVLALAGFCFWMAALHWLRLPHPATIIGWIVLSFYFAFYIPAFVGLARVAVHRLRTPVILAAPVVWTGLELARAHVLTGMTMGSLGHTQYRWVGLIQVSDLAGAFGVSFVVMFVAACLARTLPCDGRRWAVWPVAPAVAMLGAVLAYGQVRIDANSEAEAGPKIALIQGSIDVTMQYDPDLKDRALGEYFNLSREATASEGKVDLIVWPEAMFPFSLVNYTADAKRPASYEGTDAEFHQQLEDSQQNAKLMAKMAHSLGAPLLLGVDTYEFGPEGEEVFNSGVYIARDGRQLGRYSKMHLVMFGEYVPFAKQFPFLQGLTPLPVSVTPGDGPAVFDVPWDGRTCRIAPNICYESVLSHVIRGHINTLTAEGKEPEVLVNLTNDGWYWGSSELDMHLACGVFRAVECRKPFLVAANTGFSASIDGNGQILEQGPRRATGFILAQPTLDRRTSWYLDHGDWFAGICLTLCGLCGLVGLRSRFFGSNVGQTPRT